MYKTITYLLLGVGLSATFACTRAVVHPSTAGNEAPLSVSATGSLADDPAGGEADTAGLDYADEATYDIPMVLNHSVENHIDYFGTRGRAMYQRWLDRSEQYIPMMKKILRENNLPEDLVYVAMIESGFSTSAVSWANAVGPWQFMTATAKMYGLKINRWVDERRDPIKSTKAAARHLRRLHTKFGSWPLALASYNAGCGKVQRAVVKTSSEDFWDLRATPAIASETKNYVPKYMAAIIIAKNPERYGFSSNQARPFAYDEVAVKKSTDLRLVARCTGSTYADMKKLNPELKSRFTPPSVKSYLLRLPQGTKEAFLANACALSSVRKIRRKPTPADDPLPLYSKTEDRSFSSRTIQNISNLKDRLFASSKEFFKASK